MNYMGIDHHKQYSFITLMDESGEVLRSERVANLRSEVEKALARLDAGSYGACIECGQAIAEERLAALPAAALCFDCADA